MLAAILARRPPILVLDEPLSMLDTTAAHELVCHLTELAVRQGSAIVVCEHRSHYIAKMFVKLLLAVWLHIPAGFVAFGLLYTFITNSVAGVLGGLLGWLILRALRRAGFFAYLAEKK